LAAVLAACARPSDLYIGGDLPAFAADSGTAPLDARQPDPPAMMQQTPSFDAALPERDAEPPPVICVAFAADCDGDAANGCETDLRSDPAHCGACHSECDNADCVCRDGQKQLACRPGHADCDGMPANGCEIDTQTDLQHCGGCNKLCHTNGHDALTATCTAGRCEITCRFHPFPQIDCDNDPDNGCETQAWLDDQNCGMCGVRCTCNNGVCE
jgi:hypothetical protein